MTPDSEADISKRLRTTRLLSQNLQMRLQNEAADEIECLRAVLLAIHAEGMKNHATRCAPWWGQVRAQITRLATPHDRSE